MNSERVLPIHADNAIKSIIQLLFLFFGLGPIWLDDLNCPSSAEIIEDCTHRGWGVHNCDHDDDVSVVCDPGNTCNNSRLSSTKV